MKQVGRLWQAVRGYFQSRLDYPPAPSVGCGIANPTERWGVVGWEEGVTTHCALVLKTQAHGIHFESAGTFQVSQPVQECRGQQVRSVLRQGEPAARRPLRIDMGEDKQFLFRCGHG